MSDATTLLRGVTEDHGSYNRHAATQAAGGAFALPLLRKAARERALDAGDGPIVIADYGSSQGKNSLKPMRAAIAVLGGRLSGRRPICVVHILGILVRGVTRRRSALTLRSTARSSPTTSVLLTPVCFRSLAFGMNGTTSRAASPCSPAQ